jgi:hypothetical protein
VPVDIISDSCAFQQSSWGKKYSIVKRVAIKKDDTDNIAFLNIEFKSYYNYLLLYL